MKYRYIVIQDTYKEEDATSVGFGIAVVEERCGVNKILESISNLSKDSKPVEELVQTCNDLQLAPIHLQDVVTDFLSTV